LQQYSEQAAERGFLAMCHYDPRRYEKMVEEKNKSKVIESLEQIDPDKMYVKFTIPARDIEVIVITAEPTDAFTICGWLVNTFRKMGVEPKTNARFPDNYKFDKVLP